ncbi:hypothetical protein ONE63_006308 [Megalurothrips usitatus]|uniref:Uncharacterized protein n=1 Tax=Megalurothrips usitatus TaxID=439358 RepID=A0AAV7XTZ5_9NEOP|nr:hypothetical protein ONE63_006308 [Megalurothrips usitatus]
MDMHRLKNGVDKKEGDTVSQTSSMQKRKKNSGRSRQSTGYLQEWVHQSRSFMTPASPFDPQYGQLVGPYWEVAGSPRMYAAISDPTVCRYSVPTAPPPALAYSYEPVSLPIYQQTYQPAVPPSPVGVWRSPQHLPSHGSGSLKPDGVKHISKSNASQSSRVSKNCSSRQISSKSPSSQPQNLQGYQEEYLSLPPGSQQGCDLEDSHRRFSDPGLARAEPDSVPTNNVNTNNTNNNLDEGNESGDWTQDSGSSSSQSGNFETNALSEQLNILKADNKRLAQELRDTRAELHKLKLQAATWGSPIQQDYQPGMIADLVREIRDAAQLREETLLSRLRLMMADGGILRLTGSNANEKDNIHNRDLQANSQDSQFCDDARDSERIARLERQLNNLQLHNGNSEASRREDQLRRELQEAQAARKMAESNVHKLEKLMNMMRKKMNGVTASSEHDGDGDGLGGAGLQAPTPAPASPAPSSLESLTSACSSSSTSTSTHAPCPPGPVTDL